MEISTALTEALGKYMDLASDEMKLTAGNVANVDTPGFHTMGMDFDAEFQRALTLAAGEAQDNANTNATGAKSKPRIREVDGLVERPDGNNVSLDREGMKMAEVQLKFRVAAALLKHELGTISEAIHVDGK